MGEEQNLDGQEAAIPEDDGIIIEGGEESASEESGEESQEEVEEPTGDDSGEEPEKEINQESVNKRINKIHFEKKQAEEREAQAVARAKDLEERLAAATKKELPAVPEVPDLYDPDYAAKMLDRDKIIQEHGRNLAEKQLLENQTAESHRQSQAAERAKVETMVAGFYDGAKKLSIDKAKIDESQNIVSKYIPGRQELAKFLLSDEVNGPLNVLYLSQNLAEMEKVAGMSDVQASVYIATKVAPEAAKLKVKKSKTPAPPYHASGRTVAKSADPILKGCTFE